MTLIEALATLLLIGIVLPVVMQGLTSSMRDAARARHVTEAAMLAETKINELLIVRDASAFTGEGDFGPQWPEYWWHCVSFPAEAGLYEVSVTVQWIERGDVRSVRLSTLVLPSAQEVWQ